MPQTDPSDLSDASKSGTESIELRPTLAAQAAIAAGQLADMLDLPASRRERLVQSVGLTGQPAAVVANQLGLAPETTIAEASAGLHATPIWAEPLPSRQDLAGGHGLNPRFLLAHHAAVLRADAEGLVVGLVDAGVEAARRGIRYAADRPVTFATLPFSAWRNLSARALHDGPEIETETAANPDPAARDAPVVTYLDSLLERAVAERASDIHLEQKIDRCIVRFRIDGDLRDADILPAAFGLGVVARVKVLADLDVATVRSPQDGRAMAPVRGETIDMRISTTPTVHGESVVIRLLARQGVDFTLDSLGFDPDFVAALGRQLRKPHGLILVTGPTGSGKTTTLYAALRRLGTRQRKVLTVEDPIEYVFDGINQTQVNEAAGVSFASALRAFLRHDPDVILVGEIRDSETARLAVQAALTGHLVLATLHTNDAATAPARLMDMGVEGYLLSSVLVGVSAQRLIPRLCPACSTVRPATEEERALFSRHGAAAPEAGLREPRGCRECDETGRIGRAPIGETFDNDTTIERLIATGAPTADIRAHLAASPGFAAMARRVLDRVGRGELCLDDAYRTVGL